MIERWDRFWFGTEAPFNLAVARLVVSVNALWILLSRPDWPRLFDYPPAMWRAVESELWFRFGFTGNVDVERMLFTILHLALVTAAIGWFPRASSLVAGLLLYHFAPLETIFWSANPYLRGLTIPCLALLVLSFAPHSSVPLFGSFREPARDGARWPLRLVQVFFCQMYLFAAWSKLYEGGLGWITAGNIRGWLVVLDQILGWSASPTPADWVIQFPSLMMLMALAGFFFDLLFPLVLFFPRARWIFLPAALLFHLGNVELFRIHFHNLPLLLLFFDWQRVFSNRRMTS